MNSTAANTLSVTRSHGGTLHVVSHASEATGTDMTFSIFLPPAAEEGTICPVVWYLSGLTCTHANVTEKGEYRRACAEVGLIFVAPDTSPRGEQVPTDPDGGWDFGLGAGFYVDATEAPWSANYRMYSYVVDELPGVVAAHFPVDMGAQAMMGHSMGGHGALVASLRNPGRYRSTSAFAPIVAPTQVPFGLKAFPRYLGADEAAWRAYDSVALIEDGARLPELLVDQGDADSFKDTQLRPDLLEAACREAGIPATFNYQPGYDHGYYFISSFMEDHLRWHAERLK